MGLTTAGDGGLYTYAYSNSEKHNSWDSGVFVTIATRHGHRG